jgi:putative ABC transport system substrate-binding protein
MAWSPHQEKQFRIAVRYVDQILKGARPGDLPIRHPERYSLILNTRAAGDLGLVVAASLPSQTDRVLPRPVGRSVLHLGRRLQGCP